MRRPGAAHKYRVSPKAERTYNGTVYHSKAEARYAAELDLQKRVGLIREWSNQVPFQITVNGVNICKVVVDFSVVYSDGRTQYVEIKGKETEAYRLKRKLLAACYPDLDYVVLKAWRKA